VGAAPREVRESQRWRVSGWTFLVLASLCAVLLPRSARAAGEDAAVNEIVQKVLVEEYAKGEFGPARHKLEAGLDRCKSTRCTPVTRSQVHVLLAMIASQTGHKDEAIATFATALKENPAAKLPNMGTPDIKTAFAEAQKQVAPPEAPPPPPPPPPPPAPAPPPAAPTPAPAPAPAPPAADEPTVANAEPAAPAAPGKPRVVAGWANPDAFELAAAAVAADQVGKLDVCIEKNRESLKLEEQPRTRLHLSSCETRSGHLIDALGDAQKALKAGIEHRDAPVMRAARNRVGELLQRIPHVTFAPPPGATDLNVTFDDRAVPTDALTKKFSVDPGTHTVHAEGELNGLPLTFDKEYEVKEAELVIVQIVLTSTNSGVLTPGQLKCMLTAKSQEEVTEKCLPQTRKNLVVKAGFELNGYEDTDHVDVFSPVITGSVASPTSGWNVGGTYIIDIVSAASPDIVSEASPPFHEVRNAGTLTGGYKPGKFGAQGTVNVSSEPDYLSIGGGVAVTADMAEKLITPRLAYSFREDTIGRGGTSFAIFHHNLAVNVLEGGATFILSPKALILVNASLQMERGDQSKPYRYIPLFDPSVAPFVPRGATVDLVNSVRLPLRPLEQLPLERDRYAMGARFVSRLGSGTLRIEERLYHDTWQQNATTTDFQYIMDFGRRLHVWPHARFNAQTGANFYQLAYSALIQNGTVIVPTYRTTSRELAPSVAGTIGAGGHFALTSPEAKTQYGVFVQGDILYEDFLDSLYVTDATAFYGTIGFDAEFQ